MKTTTKKKLNGCLVAQTMDQSSIFFFSKIQIQNASTETNESYEM